MDEGYYRLIIYRRTPAEPDAIQMVPVGHGLDWHPEWPPNAPAIRLEYVPPQPDSVDADRYVPEGA